ncbi:M20 family metallopeptidase [Vibrio viridaestus]|uniref:M20 family peptidase n=1 Tax=Vibrio viridaestus TaxID=2487322 RepID=A0A3N9TH58_9VIBR|nr:M20 family metallopeptidase [Vibrio viridaestus]RQW63529.1 M20 family peptidase [Vibrio viridaestus]
MVEPGLIEYVETWLEQHNQDMVSMLETLVNIDSFSQNIDGVKKVRDTIIEHLTEGHVLAEAIDVQDTVGVLAFVGGERGKTFALTGHMDTVFPTGEVEIRPYTSDGERGYGPGVADMKAGLVMNTHLLMAFRSYELHNNVVLPFRLALLMTGDEEIGSPKGRNLIFKYLEQVDAVFNAEPGRVSGNVVTSRKGGGTYELKIKGKAAHAGVNHKDGISAIGALAEMITAIHGLTDYEKGITTNVGVISGGTTPNTVAEYASAKIDVRFVTIEQGEWLDFALQDIVTTHSTKVEVGLAKIAGFLPFEEKMSEMLMSVYREQSQALGLSIDGEFTGGCSDAGWTSSMGIPTLCATGPVGGHAHTSREYCLLNTFYERSRLVARCCVALV